MMDLALSGGWIVVFAFGVSACVALRAFGVPSTYVRDVLHIGTGVWVLGWPMWTDRALPIAITVIAAIGIAILPRVAQRIPAAGKLVRAVTGDDEHWGGLVLYTIAYALFTAIGVVRDPFPAAAALLALSLGDGIGGAVGRVTGTHYFRAPGGKRKSYEGSIVVALGAAAGVLVAAKVLGVSIAWPLPIVAGIVAALAEAFAPRGTDNLIVPIAVWTAIQLVT